MVTKPTDKQIDTAIAWLNDNEGDAGEAEACQAVALWLAEQQVEAILRSEARKARIPVAALRRRLQDLNLAKEVLERNGGGK
jgi:hypothetical protein